MHKAVLIHLNNQQDSLRPKSHFWILIYAIKLQNKQNPQTNQAIVQMDLTELSLRSSRSS